MKPRFERPIAHRGLHDRASGIVENSLSAFAAAIEHGYDIECDVQLSRDGAAMVFHDDDLARLTGRDGRVVEHSAVALDGMTLLGSRAGDTVPTLSAMLQMVDGRALIQIELKRQPTAALTERLARAVVTQLARYAGPVVLESFDPNLLIAARHAGARVPLGIITHAYEQQGANALSPVRRFVLRHLLHWPATRFEFISCRAEALSLPAVRLFRAIGLPVTAWTIRTAREAAAARPHCDQVVFEGFSA